MAYGWIKLNRGILEHKFWTEKRKFSRAEAWIDLLLSVFYEERTIIINGQSVTVEPGQYCTTVVHLADRWGWSRFKTDSYLHLLETEHMISIKKASKYTVLTLLNWGKYQDDTIEKMHKTNTKQASEMHQKSIKKAQNKNIKNIKNVKNNNIYTYPSKNGWGKQAYKPYETDDVDLSVFEE